MAPTNKVLQFISYLSGCYLCIETFGLDKMRGHGFERSESGIMGLFGRGLIVGASPDFWFFIEGDRVGHAGILACKIIDIAESSLNSSDVPQAVQSSILATLSQIQPVSHETTLSPKRSVSMELKPVNEWWNAQRERQSPESLGLEIGGLYAIDGGVFQAIEENGRVELWTWLGKSGYVVARTGFEIDAEGGVHDRIYDLECEQQMVGCQPRFAVNDLTPVTKAQAMNLTSTMSVEEFLERLVDEGRAL